MHVFLTIYSINTSQTNEQVKIIILYHFEKCVSSEIWTRSFQFLIARANQYNNPNALHQT